MSIQVEREAFIKDKIDTAPHHRYETLSLEPQQTENSRTGRGRSVVVVVENENGIHLKPYRPT